ncbi:MAG TPA: hypothetical protein VLS96_20180 [Nodosilinea sp.]|nr:hypothetical protein [Nodosilinea sp.]
MHVLESGYLESDRPQGTPQPATTVELDRITRWAVYRRLQELEMGCDCGCDRTLTVAIHTPADALLLWSVVQTATQPKPALADHLERCWQHRSQR